MPSVHNRLLFPVLLALLLANSCRSGMREDSERGEPTIHWWGVYSFYEIPYADEEDFRAEYGVLEPIARGGRGPIYRVPAAKTEWLEENGYRRINDVPFRYVDPDIDRRRESDDPAVWFSGYKDRETVEKILLYLEKSRPELCRRYVIGKSVRNRPIEALRISKNPEVDEDEPSLMFNGAHHGNELLSIDYVLDMAALLLDVPGVPVSAALRARFAGFTPEERRRILESFEVWIVPVVNPDGLDDYWNRSIHAGRKNARGVDLNRNYPFYWGTGQTGASGNSSDVHDYRGPSAGSEPETKVMMDFAERERFTIVFSYHTFATRVLFPYTIDGVMNPWPDRAWFYARSWAGSGESFRTERQYAAARKLYSVDGTDQDWLFYKYGTLAYIVEGSMNSPLYTEGLRSIAGMRPIWKSALLQMLAGPRLELKVVDASGHPLRGAEVRLLDEVRFENERWTVHPQTGRFDLLPGPLETLHLEIVAEGYQSARKKISCKSICKEKFYLTR